MRSLKTTVRALLLAPAIAICEETHPFNAKDLWSMERVSSQQVSPDGDSVVFVVRRTDFEANRGRTDLWLIGTDGGLIV